MASECRARCYLFKQRTNRSTCRTIRTLGYEDELARALSADNGNRLGTVPFIGFL